MRRIAVSIAACVAVAAALATAAAASGGAAVNLRNTSDGKILVNNKGFTLYMFTRDSKNKDECVKISMCTTFWPPLTTTGKPVAGSGIKTSLLGTIKYRGSLKQVTYAGHPLYTYKQDSAPGSTSYINVQALGGRWPALNAAGNAVTGSKTSSTTNSSSSSTGYRYG